MPKLSDSSKLRLELKQKIAEQAEFKSGFGRSRAGNLWREWDGGRVIILRGSDGKAGWMLYDCHDNKRCSDGQFESEDEAMNSLWRELVL